MNLGVDLAARLRAYAEADRRTADAVVADAVEEYLATHPNHEQLRAAGLAAMRQYEAEYGPFTEAEWAEADAWIDRLFGPGNDEHGGSLAGGPPDGSDV
ncbi:CopG family ribbon-helix-helix protein [Streptomyces sp. NPDC002845]